VGSHRVRGNNQFTEDGFEAGQNGGGPLSVYVLTNFGGNNVQGPLMPIAQNASGGLGSSQTNLIYTGNGNWSDAVTYTDALGSHTFGPYAVTGANIDGGAVAEAGEILVGNINDGSSMNTWTNVNFQIRTAGGSTVTQWNGDVIDNACSRAGQLYCMNGGWNPPNGGWNSNLT
jgi:hypothetical protein